MKKSKLSLKKATANETEKIRSLAYEIWYGTYREIISIQQIEYMLDRMYNPLTLAEEIRNKFEWNVIQFNNEIIGFYSLEKLSSNLVKLNKFYIKSEFQKMGIGGWVIENIKSDLIQNQFKTLTLNVNRFNQKAINAYMKYGFIVEKSADIPYGDFILNDYVLILNLTTE